MVRNLKVVLDTNIYISSLLTKGTSREVTELALDQAFAMFVSPFILAELYACLTRKLDYSQDEAKKITKTIGQLAEIIDISHELEVENLTDPNDNPIIETAVTAAADFLVTNDDRLLAVRKYGGVEIRTAAEFLSVLKNLPLTKSPRA